MHKRVCFTAAWLCATLLFSGCGSDDDEHLPDRYRVLNVDHLWQGSLPVEFSIDESMAGDCPNEGETGLLVPFSFLSNETLQVEMYGCWLSEAQITCGDGLFREADIDLSNDGRVIISLLREDALECPGVEPTFQKLRTFDIDNDWQPGELEVIVRNSDGDLSQLVTVN